MKSVALFLVCFLTASTLQAQKLVAVSEPTPAQTEAKTPPEEPACPEGYTCVTDADMQKFIELLKDRKCLDESYPQFKLDDVVIVTDSDNRTFYTGKGTKVPYTMTMTWCHYDVKAKGEAKVIAAIKEPPVWGFRFRPKASVQYLPLLALFQNNAYSGIDVGVGADFLYYKSSNLGAHLGFRSVGLVGGVDITQNFGFNVGWAIAWEALVNPKSAPLNNLNLGFYFAF